MFDLTNIQSKNNVQVFTSANTWQTWVKPARAKLVYILCIGGGAGGESTTAAAGGSGGASSPLVTALFNANALPDTLYVYAGLKGRGGIGAISGSSPADNSVLTGSISYVTVVPDTGSVTGIVCRSANTPSQLAGNVGATATVANMPLINLAIQYNIVAGIAGSTPNAVTPANLFPSTIVTGGVAGARNNPGSAGPGQYIAATAYTPLIAGGLNQAGARDAGSGTVMYKPFLCFLGGGGGGGTVGGVQGGRGGNAAYGCGGGGCGGTGTGTSSPGGNGGDGIVIITTSF